MCIHVFEFMQKFEIMLEYRTEHYFFSLYVYFLLNITHLKKRTKAFIYPIKLSTNLRQKVFKERLLKLWIKKLFNPKTKFTL